MKQTAGNPFPRRGPDLRRLICAGCCAPNRKQPEQLLIWLFGAAALNAHALQFHCERQVMPARQVHEWPSSASTPTRSYSPRGLSISTAPPSDSGLPRRPPLARCRRSLPPAARRCSLPGSRPEARRSRSPTIASAPIRGTPAAPPPQADDQPAGAFRQFRNVRRPRFGGSAVQGQSAVKRRARNCLLFGIRPSRIIPHVKKAGFPRDECLCATRNRRAGLDAPQSRADPLNLSKRACCSGSGSLRFGSGLFPPPAQSPAPASRSGTSRGLHGNPTAGRRGDPAGSMSAGSTGAMCTACYNSV